MTHAPPPWLSMVIPIKDERDNLQPLTNQLTKVLGSLEPSHGSPFEILYVDDGSTDGSSALLDEIRRHTPEVRVIHFDRNHGQTAAFAAGFRHARGELNCHVGRRSSIRSRGHFPAATVDQRLRPGVRTPPAAARHGHPAHLVTSCVHGQKRRPPRRHSRLRLFTENLPASGYRTHSPVPQHAPVFPRTRQDARVFRDRSARSTFPASPWAFQIRSRESPLCRPVRSPGRPMDCKHAACGMKLFTNRMIPPTPLHATRHDPRRLIPPSLPTAETAPRHTPFHLLS